MEYIILPAELLNEITQETLEHLHLSPRYSIDGTEVLMKVDNYEKLFPRPMTLELDNEETEPVCPYPTYDNPSEAFDTLLSSPAWISEEDPV